MKVLICILCVGFWLMPKIIVGQAINLSFLDKTGKPTSFEALLQAALEADIVFFGERHDDSLAHLLEFRLVQAMHKNIKTKFLVGMEMFETDNQILIDEYISGICSERNFEAEAKLWPNYESDYKPVLKFCKAEKIALIATNVPRRYAGLTAREGTSALSNLSFAALQLMAPLPFNYDSSLLAYKFLSQQFLSNHSNFMPLAQALKDATMAWSIHKNLNNGAKLLHINGSFHSDYHQGIVWHLKKYRPELKILVISIGQGSGLLGLVKSKNKSKNLVMPIADFIYVSGDK